VSVKIVFASTVIAAGFKRDTPKVIKAIAATSAMPKKVRLIKRLREADLRGISIISSLSYKKFLCQGGGRNLSLKIKRVTKSLSVFRMISPFHFWDFAVRSRTQMLAALHFWDCRLIGYENEADKQLCARRLICLVTVPTIRRV
jgi:hypothetical protein